MNRFALRASLVIATLPLAGCVRAPVMNILGSYFPAWMFCALLGILLAVLVRVIVTRFRLEEYARPAVLTYPCVAALFTLSTWLLFFS